ncbi:MAG: molecular chaperone DnaJ, partial [Bacilli bacterium]|nr:molecular chaperone DnaJ [Bacilli bacterium]
RDLAMQVQVDFMDAINGKVVPVSINHDETCETCHGTGAKSPDAIKVCPTCKGSGRVLRQHQSLFGVMQEEVTCP